MRINKKNSISLSVIMIIFTLFSIAIFSGCADLKKNNNSAAKQTEYNSAFYECKEFCEKTLLVVLNNKISIKYNYINGDVIFKKFDIDDFPIALSSISCVTPGIEQVKMQLEDLHSGNITNNTYDMGLDKFKRILVLTLSEPGRDNILAAIKELENSPYIYSVHPNYIFASESSSYPDDSFSQSHNTELQWGLDQILAKEAQNISKGSSEIVVGVLDSGIDADHPGLKDIIDRNLTRCFLEGGNTPKKDPISGEIYDEFQDLNSKTSHGTKVAGIISNSITGVAKNVRLASLRVSGWKNNRHNAWEVSQFLSSTLKAIKFASSPETFIHILNWSAAGILTHPDDIPALDEAIRLYGNAGGLFVAAAGNDGLNIDEIPNHTAAIQQDNFIAVGASDQQSRRIMMSNGFFWSSNFGPEKVHVFAPGTNIRTTTRGGGYVDDFNGTSSAAPHVAGVAALMLSVNPSLTPLEIKTAIMANADIPSYDGSNPLQSYCVSGGRLNAFKAVSSVAYKTNAAGDTITGLNFEPDGPLTLPEELGGVTITGIGAAAFSGAIGLTGIKLPKSVAYIDAGAFSFCDNLTEITAADDNPVFKSDNNCLIRKSGGTLALGCKASVIPDYVQSIASGAFYGCRALGSIYIPAGVTDIGEKAFYGCSGITSITAADANPVFKSENNCLIRKSESTLVTGCKTSAIPPEVTGIESYAFAGNTALDYIVIPSVVGNIGNGAFYGCTDLEDIVFSSCSRLARLGMQAFAYCRSLESIALPASIEYIDRQAFAYCSSLSEVYIQGDFSENGIITIATYLSSVFSGCNNLGYIIVPDSETALEYKRDSKWSELASIVYVKNSETDVLGWMLITDSDENDTALAGFLHFYSLDAVFTNISKLSYGDITDIIEMYPGSGLIFFGDDGMFSEDIGDPLLTIAMLNATLGVSALKASMETIHVFMEKSGRIAPDMYSLGFNIASEYIEECGADYLRGIFDRTGIFPVVAPAAYNDVHFLMGMSHALGFPVTILSDAVQVEQTLRTMIAAGHFFESWLFAGIDNHDFILPFTNYGTDTSKLFFFDRDLTNLKGFKGITDNVYLVSYKLSLLEDAVLNLCLWAGSGTAPDFDEWVFDAEQYWTELDYTPENPGADNEWLAYWNSLGYNTDASGWAFYRASHFSVAGYHVPGFDIPDDWYAIWDTYGVCPAEQAAIRLFSV